MGFPHSAKLAKCCPAISAPSESVRCTAWDADTAHRASLSHENMNVMFPEEELFSQILYMVVYKIVNMTGLYSLFILFYIHPQCP